MNMNQQNPYKLNPDELDRMYNACLDSVFLLDTGKPIDMDQETWAHIVDLNLEHLKSILLNPDFETKDLTPIQEVIEKYSTK